MQIQIDSGLYQESVTTVYKLLRYLGPFLQTFGGVAVVFYLFKEDLYRDFHGAWLVTMLLLSMIDFWILNSFFTQSTTKAQFSKSWEYKLSAINFILSCHWGALVMSFDMTNVQLVYGTMLILAFAIGICSFAMGLLHSFLISFCLPMLTACTVTLAQTAYLYEFSTLISFTLIICIVFVRVFRFNFKAAYDLREEKNILIADLAEQKAKAEQANLGKSKFLAAASHDLRQPLQSVSLLLAAQSMYLEEGKAKDILGKAKKSMGDLTKLLDSLLDISKLDAGAVVPELLDVPLTELIRGLSDKYESLLVAKGVQLKIQIDRRYFVKTDPILLNRILSNLMDNAYRYTEEGSVSINVCSRKSGVLISITDTGKGVDGQELDAIFSEFYQVENHERDRRKGIGLGLAIVKRLASVLGFDITVQSEPGVGSAFSLYIPNLIQRNASLAEATEIGQMEHITPEAKTILVVDDERDIRESMSILIESLGCKAVQAESSQEAIVKLTRLNSPIDGMIVDYRLGRHETGIECIESITRFVSYPFGSMIITGDTDRERVLELENSGIAYSHKPVNEQEIMTFIEGLGT